MRISFAGGLNTPDPRILMFDESDSFNVASWVLNGYTHFDVICIGGGGGSGGGIDTNNTGTKIRSYGGMGGGGGFHQVRGFISALPNVVDIVVGSKGDSGTDHASNHTLTTDGEDGGYSSFNNSTCRASGGKGGKRVKSNSTIVPTYADGGQGGVGNSVVAGGGADGGVAGIPSATGPGNSGTDGEDGYFLNNVGQGGGGGAGGVGLYDDEITANAATSGGRGSYDAGDTSAYAPGESPSTDPDSNTPNIVPGKGGGAKGSRLNGLPTVYGRSGEDGIVILKLTKE